MIPDFMNPQSTGYDANWHNRTDALPYHIWTRFSNGQVHQTNNPIHLARWIADNGAVIIEKPEAQEVASE